MSLECRYENIGWTVGNHCNAKCGHCYSWKARRHSDEFLTPGDVERIVAQLQRLGVKTVNLGGNEPLYTHGSNASDTLLPFIIRTLSNAGIPVGLTTNGVTFIYLAKFHPEELAMLNDIDFSLDSPYQEEHDLNRGGTLYKSTLKAIRQAVEMGIDCSVITCGMKGNFTREHLSAFLALTQHLGSEFRINTLKPLEPALLEQMPSAEQYYDGFEFLMRHTDCITLGESCLNAFVESGTPGCPCGTSSFRINAKTRDGRVPISPCVYMHDFSTGDLLRDDILDIVESPSFREFAARRHAAPTECREMNCEYLEHCRGGCAARTYFTRGKLDARDPYCPKEHVARTGRKPALPVRPEIGVDHGVRVHDNYLCTWIGQVRPGFEDERFPTLAHFQAQAPRTEQPLSGCRQVAPQEATVSLDSLVRVSSRKE